MCNVHGGGGGDVDGGDVDRPGDGHGVLQAHRGGDVDGVGANVHLGCDGDRVVGGDAPVHHRGDRGGYGHGGGGGGVADVIGVFITGVKVGLAVGLQVAGDVGSTQHLPTDAAGDFSFMSDHVRSESVFGGES